MLGSRRRRHRGAFGAWAPRALVATAAVAALVVIGGLGGRADAQGTDVETQARIHFAGGEYGEALEIYKRLYAETLHPTYLRNVGRCYQNMGEPDKAISAFREYLRKAEDLPPKQRAEIDRYILEMEALLRQRAAGQVSAAAPAAPPAAPPPVARPTRTVAGDNPAASERVEASLKREAGHRSAQDESAPVYQRWWFWTLIGGVVAGGVVAAVVISSGGGNPSASTTLGTMHSAPPP